MIPRIIHQYSDGAAASAEDHACAESWRKWNTSWEYKLWPRDLARRFLSEYFGEGVATSFDDCTSPPVRILVFSSAVLLAFGGVYAAAQLECIRSIDNLVDSIAQAAIGPVHRGENLDRLAPILTEGLFAARKGACGAGRTLTAALGAIATGDAVQDVWRRLYMTEGLQNDTSELSTIDPELFREFVRPPKNTQLRKRGANEDSRRDARIMRLAPGRVPNRKFCVRWMGFLFLGHPRCGSRALSKMLFAAGLHVGHERPGPDGSVSWWHTGRLIRRALWPSFSHGAGDDGEIWLAGRIFHYLRDPREAIPSIVLENEFRGRDNNSFKVRRRVIERRFEVDIGELDALGAAATSYALWNKIAEDLATDGRVFVERPELSDPPAHLAPIPLLRRNDSERKFGTLKPGLDVMDSIRRSPAKARPLLERYLSLYLAND